MRTKVYPLEVQDVVAEPVSQTNSGRPGKSDVFFVIMCSFLPFTLPLSCMFMSKNYQCACTHVHTVNIR